MEIEVLKRLQPRPTPEAADAVLKVKDLHFSYRLGDRRVPVLRGVNLEIRPGEFIAIQGSSGSGKSTLLYLLGCLLDPDHGEILLNRQEVLEMSREERAFLRNRTIGFVFQQFHLLPRATVLENILLPTSYPCELAGPRSPEQVERATRIATELGLAEHLNHMPNQLSGGQQQRVAVARALMNDVDLILADEPTGNLDSASAAQTMELFRELHRRGKAIILITHDREIARQAQTIYHIRDGQFTHREPGSAGPALEAPSSKSTAETARGFRTPAALARSVRALLPLAAGNIRRNKARSFLTMLGITIGIASVLAMITLGEFTQARILETYESLGVNKVLVEGYPNWRLKATDRVDVKFQSFHWEKDILKLKEIFPQVQRLSPVLQLWNVTVGYNGNQISNDVTLRGVNADFGAITNAQLAAGKFLNPHQVAARSSVCVIGSDISRQLFRNVSPVGQLLYITTGAPTPFNCLVIGVLKPQKSNSEWNKPSSQILVPFTLLPAMAQSWWEGQLHRAVIQLASGSDIEGTSKAIQSYFQQKYGKSGRFTSDSDAILLAQMKKFLSLFTLLLASIAFLSLFVGGIGITNMMLVSVTERVKEIGLRKALGATDYSIRIQLLLEAVLLCGLAGLVGAALGFGMYEAILYGASHFVSQLQFEWVVNTKAVLISVVAVVGVGIASGILPALRAERLQVIEALRSE